MSHAASHYVKHLVTAPNGERITTQEKAVLGLLADDHREDAGVAWPSVGTLAKRACVSERQCRRILAGLERKCVLGRRPMMRDKDGGQSSNDYVFVELDNPLSEKALVENRRKVQRTPRSPMTGGGGHPRQGGADTGDRGGADIHDRGPRTLVSAHDLLRDSSVDLLSDSLVDLYPLPPSQANGVEKRSTEIDQCTSLKPLRELLGRPAPSVQDVWTGVMRDVDRHLLSTRPKGVAASGGDDWRSYHFGRLAVVGAQLEGDGDDAKRVLIVSSPDPRATAEGLKKYKPTWDRALEKWYKAPVEIRLMSA